MKKETNRFYLCVKSKTIGSVSQSIVSVLTNYIMLHDVPGGLGGGGGALRTAS